MISPTHFTPIYPSITDCSVENAHPSERGARTRRNVGEPAKYWPQNSTLKIALSDYEMNDPYVVAVKNAASQWLPHINLRFEFVSGDTGDVRITQHGNKSGGSSEIGTDAVNTFGTPTMLLPLDHTAANFEYTVIHEFGHMLGALHAHQHPDATISWNLPALSRQFTQSMLQDNFLKVARSGTYDLLPYDPDSVMHYSTQSGWTTDTVVHSRNAMLSQGDIAWAKKAYPRAPATAE